MCAELLDEREAVGELVYCEIFSEFHNVKALSAVNLK